MVIPIAAHKIGHTVTRWDILIIKLFLEAMFFINDIILSFGLVTLNFCIHLVWITAFIINGSMKYDTWENKLIKPTSPD